MPSQIDLGIIILYTENQFFIESITPNSSAAEADPKIEDFDIITHIDDVQLTDDDTYESVIAKLHNGAEGSTVKLTLFRAESPIFDVKLKRKLVESDEEILLQKLKSAMETWEIDTIMNIMLESGITSKDINEYVLFKKYLNEKKLNDDQRKILRSLYGKFTKYDKFATHTKEDADHTKEDTPVKPILTAIKTGTTSNNINHFYEIMINFNNEFEIPILVRYTVKPWLHDNMNGLYGFYRNSTEESLSGIYFMGTDTDIKVCKIKKCNIIHDLYELTDGSKLNKTDLEISAYDKNPNYAQELQNLKEYIDTSGTNIFSILILSKLPTDHNTFKIISKEMLLTLSDIPLAVAKGAAKAPFKIVRGAADGTLAVAKGFASGARAVGRFGLNAAATILQFIGTVLKGGNIKKTRKNRKYKRNVSRRYIRNGINNNICK